GIGYYRVHSQVQVFDSRTTTVAVGLKAFAPAGAESGGLANGPPVLSPTLSLFQDLGWGTGLHGFVGQHIHAAAGWTDSLDTRGQYGMAWHCAAPGLSAGPDRGLFLFVEALGRFRYDGDVVGPGRANVWEVVPGVHWRVADSCWLSVGASRLSMITCSWKF